MSFRNPNRKIQPHYLTKSVVAFIIKNGDATKRKLVHTEYEEQWVTVCPKDEHYYGKPNKYGEMYETYVRWHDSVPEAITYLQKFKIAHPTRSIMEPWSSNDQLLLEQRIKEADDELKRLKKERAREKKEAMKSLFG